MNTVNRQKQLAYTLIPLLTFSLISHKSLNKHVQSEKNITEQNFYTCATYLGLSKYGYGKRFFLNPHAAIHRSIRIFKCLPLKSSSVLISLTPICFKNSSTATHIDYLYYLRTTFCGYYFTFVVLCFRNNWSHANTYHMIWYSLPKSKSVSHVVSWLYMYGCPYISLSLQIKYSQKIYKKNKNMYISLVCKCDSLF